MQHDPRARASNPNYGRGTHTIEAGDFVDPDEVLAWLRARFGSRDYRPPVLPAVAMQVHNLTRRNDTAIADVVALVRRDPLLAADVLRRAQPAAFAFVHIQQLSQHLVRVLAQERRACHFGGAVRQLDGVAHGQVLAARGVVDLDHGAGGATVGDGTQLQHFGLKQNLLQQFVDAHTGLRGHRHKRRITAVLFRHHFLDHQLLLDAVRVGIGLVSLGDGHHDRHLGCLGVLDGFLGLGHDTVVRCHHQNHDVGGLGTAGTHGREGLVTGGIEERHHAAWGFDVVGANVLRDTTSFARRHLGAADVVQQRGLAVVHVAHDGDHGRTRQHLGVLHCRFLVGKGFRIVQRRHHRLVAQFFDHDHGRVLVQGLVDGGHLAQLHELLDDLGGLDRHLVGQFGHSDRLRHVNFQRANLHRRRLGVEIAPVALIATAATRTAAPVVAGPPDASAGVAAGRNGLSLRRIAGPTGRQLGRLDLLVARCSTSGRPSTKANSTSTRGEMKRWMGMSPPCAKNMSSISGA